MAATVTHSTPADGTFSVAGAAAWDAGHTVVLGADDNFVTDAEKVKLSNLSGTNTGDQTSVSGNAGSATVAATVTLVDTTDATASFVFADSATGDQALKTDGGAGYDATTGKASFAAVGGFVEPTAGTTTRPPVIVPSGTLMTTPSAGAIEMDANCMYGTTDAGNRGYFPVRHFIRCNAVRNLPNDTNLNAIFNDPANGRLTLETGTYEFRGRIHVTSMSGTSGNALMDILGAGTSTTGGWLWQVVGADANTPTAALTRTGSGGVTSATPASMLTAGTGSAILAQFEGSFEVTVAGTIIPSIQLVTASAAVVSVGTIFMIERIGTDSVVSVGQWD